MPDKRFEEKWSSFRPKYLPLLLAGVLAICYSCVTTIPPRDMTRGAITETYVRINLAIKRDGHLPKDLADLPVRSGHANDTTDGWNVPLQYSIQGTDTVTLTSLGRDGSPSGDGDDADIIGRYKLVNGELQETE